MASCYLISRMTSANKLKDLGMIWSIWTENVNMNYVLKFINYV